jgi:hypothetical protein
VGVCVLGWCAATAVFAEVIKLLDGPAAVDAAESIFSTWAIAHGQLACAFPSAALPRNPEVSPLYPLISGAVSAVVHLGSSVPYPAEVVKHHRCDEQYGAAVHWAIASHTLLPTLRLAYLSWLALMAGVIAWLRTSGRGRTGWEPLTLLVVACLPPVWQSVEGFFHPQDLIAMGLSLGAMACARRDRWAVAGVLIAGAFLSQEFAVLVAVPLFVLAPGMRRIRYLVAAIASGAIVAVPLLVMTSGTAARAIALGTGDGPRDGGTFVFGLGLSGAPLVLVSRVLPVALSLLLSWWALHRFGRDVLREPALLLIVVGLSLTLRLVFEENIFVYYLMALAVILVLLDVQRRHIRASLAAWLTCVALVFSVGWGYSAFYATSWATAAVRGIPLVVIGFAVLGIVVSLLRHGSRWNLLLCFLVALCALLSWQLPDGPVVTRTWVWQVVLVGSGVALLAGPLLERIRGAEEPKVAMPYLSSAM